MLERLRGTGQATEKNNIAVSEIETSILELEQRIQELKNTPPKVGQNDLAHQIKQLEYEKDELHKVFNSNLTPYDVVKISRHPHRPLTADYINLIVDDFVELHGDRLFGDDKAITCGLGKIGEKKILLIGQGTHQI
jgi:acetyl-CoA carboxylase carboxyl transferase subunit alpha